MHSVRVHPKWPLPWLSSDGEDSTVAHLMEILHVFFFLELIIFSLSIPDPNDGFIYIWTCCPSPHFFKQMKQTDFRSVGARGERLFILYLELWKINNDPVRSNEL